MPHKFEKPLPDPVRKDDKDIQKAIEQIRKALNIIYNELSKIWTAIDNL